MSITHKTGLSSTELQGGESSDRWLIHSSCMPVIMLTKLVSGCFVSFNLSRPLPTKIELVVAKTDVQYLSLTIRSDCRISSQNLATTYHGPFSIKKHVLEATRAG